MEIVTMLIGLTAVYVWTHFLVVQFQSSWADRSSYERAITILAIFFAVMVVLGSTS